MSPARDNGPAQTRPAPRGVFWRAFVGGSAATLLCVVALPPLLRRVGVAADDANAVSGVAWFVALFLVFWPMARAAVAQGRRRP